MYVFSTPAACFVSRWCPMMWAAWRLTNWPFLGCHRVELFTSPSPRGLNGFMSRTCCWYFENYYCKQGIPSPKSERYFCYNFNGPCPFWLPVCGARHGGAVSLRSGLGALSTRRLRAPCIFFASWLNVWLLPFPLVPVPCLPGSFHRTQPGQGPQPWSSQIASQINLLSL